MKCVCVDPYGPLVLDHIYDVFDVDRCCKLWLAVLPDDGSHGTCGCCGSPAPPGMPFTYFEADAFRPLDTLEEQLERIESEPIEEPELVHP